MRVLEDQDQGPSRRDRLDHVADRHEELVLHEPRRAPRVGDLRGLGEVRAEELAQELRGAARGTDLEQALLHARRRRAGRRADVGAERHLERVPALERAVRLAGGLEDGGLGELRLEAREQLGDEPALADARRPLDDDAGRLRLGGDLPRRREQIGALAIAPGERPLGARRSGGGEHAAARPHGGDDVAGEREAAEDAPLRLGVDPDAFAAQDALRGGDDLAGERAGARPEGTARGDAVEHRGPRLARGEAGAHRALRLVPSPGLAPEDPDGAMAEQRPGGPLLGGHGVPERVVMDDVVREQERHDPHLVLERHGCRCRGRHGGQTDGRSDGGVAQCGRELVHRLMTLRAILLEGLADHAGEPGGHRVRQGRRIVGDDPHELRGHRGRREGNAARHGVVEGRAEAPHVRSRVLVALPHGLLDRHVRGRPQEHARRGQARVVEAAAHADGEPEVEQLDRPVLAHEHVGRLEVAVDEAGAVGGGERLGGGTAEPHDLLGRQGALVAELLGEVLSLEQLHREE